jgi:glycosyltransferase involved in cell wall biosynthesis
MSLKTSNGVYKKLILSGIALLVMLNFLGFVAIYRTSPSDSYNIELMVDNVDATHEAEQKELAKLLEWCVGGNGWEITKDKAPIKEQNVESYLGSCYPIEISTSQGGRSMGHCSDFVLYIFYAGARLTNEFPAEIYKQKAQNCPNSIYLHGEYPIAILFEQQVRNYWMPNVEQVLKNQMHFFWKSDLILAKTMQSYFVVRKYVMENKIPVHVRFAPHSTPDPFYQVKNPLVAKNYNSFYHGKGRSGLKGTAQLIECWVRHPEWPILTIVGGDKREVFNHTLKGEGHNIIFSEKELPIEKVRELQVTSGVHLCPSIREGFGHYINEARALGAIVITNDFGPMNEFVTEISGVLAAPVAIVREDYQLLEPVQVSISADNICAAVEKVMKKPNSELLDMSREARRQYLGDYRRMKISMEIIRREALAHFQGEQG